MSDAVQRVEAELQQIASERLRSYCLMLLRLIEGGSGSDREPEHDRALVRGLGAVFCALGLCRSYGVAEEEKDLAVATCLCCEMTAAAGWPVVSWEVEESSSDSEPGIARVNAIVDCVSRGSRGFQRYEELLKSGGRVENVVALAFLLRRSIFSIPIPRRASSKLSRKRRASAGGRRRLATGGVHLATGD